MSTKSRKSPARSKSPKGGEEGPKKRKGAGSLEGTLPKRGKANFGIYIKRVLAQIHPDTGLTNATLKALNYFTVIYIKRICNICNVLSAHTGRITIRSSEIQAAIKLLLPGELSKHAVSEGTKAVTKWNSTVSLALGAKQAGKTKHSQAMRAGLQFAPKRVKNVMKQFLVASRIGRGGPIFLAATVEYLIAEILELAGNSSRDNKKTRIVPRHLMLAIENDDELRALNKKIIFTLDVMPNIHSILLPEKTKSGKRSKKRNEE